MRHSRHTFATDMLRDGMSLPALMQLMGHAKIQTTMVYVQFTAQAVISSTPAPWRNRSGAFLRFRHETSRSASSSSGALL